MLDERFGPKASGSRGKLYAGTWVRIYLSCVLIPDRGTSTQMHRFWRSILGNTIFSIKFIVCILLKQVKYEPFLRWSPVCLSLNIQYMVKTNEKCYFCSIMAQCLCRSWSHRPLKASSITKNHHQKLNIGLKSGFAATFLNAITPSPFLLCFAKVKWLLPEVQHEEHRTWAEVAHTHIFLPLKPPSFCHLPSVKQLQKAHYRVW